MRLCATIVFIFCVQIGFGALPNDFFPVGVWYSGGKYRAPTVAKNPLKEIDAWRRDLQNIKRLGFNSVKTWVEWANAEPSPGEYNFEGLQQLLDLANETGLRVVIQIYADAAPDWVSQVWPDADFVASNGVDIHSQSAPGPCQDNADPRAAVAAFYSAVASVGRESPAVYGYDVWSEPTLVNWVWFTDLPGVQFCYCNASMQRFRDWLQIKYGGDIQRLNSAWSRTFLSWEEVEPPRFGTILSYTDFSDWMTFTTDKLAQDLAFYASTVRAVDGLRVITSHSASPSVINSPLEAYGLPDDWRMNAVGDGVDIYGSSIYPKHAMVAIGGYGLSTLAYVADGAWSASGGRGWFVGELQGGQGVTGTRLNVPVVPTDSVQWLWTLTAHGARGIWYFAYYAMNQGYEAGGYGLIGLDGEPTDRAVAAGRAATVLSNYGKLFQRATPRAPKVAVMYNPPSYLCGGNTIGPGAAIAADMMGVYSALWARNIPVGFVHSDVFTEITPAGSSLADELAKYAVVYLPYPVVMSSNTTAAIARYVAAGGLVISEARLAWVDDRGFAEQHIPGGGLDEVFGVVEAALVPQGAYGTNQTLQFAGDAPYGLAGLEVAVYTFEEQLSVKGDGTPLAYFDDGSIAVVEHEYGLGKTMYLGTFVGATADVGNLGNEPNDAALAIQALTENWAGVPSQVAVSLNGGDYSELMEVRVLDVAADDNGTAESWIVIGIDRGGALGKGFEVTLGECIAIAGWDLLRDEPVDVLQFNGTCVFPVTLTKDLERVFVYYLTASSDMPPQADKF